ncbi:bifunctional folylpolyglutamate synthase/dihydrofolate synthase [Anaerospora hongkongensis]|uniref:bifunctional folylpolyglutamate synthase/dihydrofolate synthase n=1 Tax=Anaerospora hongkongensis TaxID=244830 RepID=UPI00289A765D|nr:folylpolyglutamate synthase/dihydrofolate synthase family protein [Anaerospora hongkongensis]
MTMSYEEALQYLHSTGKFGINLGLKRIEKLLELMGNPERRYKTVHITGTNGKGSTTAITAAVLQASGIRTGMYTSPHLLEYTERIVIDGHPITQQAFGEIIDYTRPFIETMLTEGWEHPTEFEILTAAAFHCFAAAGVEYAVIEVGLGGLLDSTNVIRPEAAVITNVTLEHTDRCGTTVAEIAGHKAGIIKKNSPVVTAASKEALAVIRKQAALMEAPLFILGEDFTSDWKAGSDGRQQVTVQTKAYGSSENLQLRLLGRHQAANCAVAVMTLKLLVRKDSRITEATIAAGVAAAVWPGRFELFAGRPAILIDGAHNAAGAQALRQTLDDVYGGRRITFVLGILRDKDVRAITGTLIRTEDEAITVAPLSERAEDPGELAALITASRVQSASTVEAAIGLAVEWAGQDGIVCVCGSLYLVGTARNIILSRQTTVPWV